MAIDEQLTQRVRQAFRRAQTPFEEKRMMGGICFLVDAKMCVGVDKSRLMVRLDPAEYENALRRKGCVPMDFTGRPMRGFVFVNPQGLDRDSDIDTWVGLALEFNPKAKTSKKKAAAPAPSRKGPRPGAGAA